MGRILAGTPIGNFWKEKSSIRATCTTSPLPIHTLPSGAVQISSYFRLALVPNKNTTLRYCIFHKQNTERYTRTVSFCYSIGCDYDIRTARLALTSGSFIWHATIHKCHGNDGRCPGEAWNREQGDVTV